jgi:iron complex transport system substrate-binding protein
MRIVSLLPAATEIVAALGAASRLVGVSHECDYPPEVRALPRVTRTRIDPALSSREIDRAVAEASRTRTAPIELELEVVARLRPDIIIGQAVCEVCAIGQAQLAGAVSRLTPTPWVVSLHAHTLLEVMVDIRKVAEAAHLTDEADELIAGLSYRLRRLRRASIGRSGSVAGGAQHAAPAPPPPPPKGKPRVLVLEWLDPPYVAGHWVPELVEFAGGEDVGNSPGAPSAARSWRELSALAPDLVVVALCGFDVSRARHEFAAVTDRDARALLSRRVEFVDGGAYTSRPGPRLVDAAELLARLIRG